MNLADRIPSTLFAKENRSMRKMLVLSVVFALATSAWGSPPGSGKQGTTLAVVNGELLTEATLMKEVENLPPYVRPILETPAGRAQFLEGVITRDLLMREALRRGMEGPQSGSLPAPGGGAGEREPHALPGEGPGAGNARSREKRRAVRKVDEGGGLRERRGRRGS